MVTVLLASVALAFPPAAERWLTHNKGEGTLTEANEYYTAIAAPPTLTAWLNKYHFSDLGDDANAVYYNTGDLGLGREMHCRENKNSSGATYRFSGEVNIPCTCLV